MNKTLTVLLDPNLAKHGISVVFLLVSGEPRADIGQRCRHLWQATQEAFVRACPPQDALGHPHLQGYRDLHRTIGVTDERLIPSPESMIRLLLAHQSLQSLGEMIDLYNAISLKHLVSAGAHDAEKLGQRLALAINQPGITFRPLGQKKRQRLPANEYSYVTDGQRAICRLECKQAHETKIRAETRSWLFVLQGNANISLASLELAKRGLLAALQNSLHSPLIDQTTLCQNSLSATLTLSPKGVD